jgi:hypothetical protein
MDVDIDPDDDKASQGNDAETPTPASAGLWKLGRALMGYAAGDRGENHLTP